ncbi:MAG: hypothetical protein ACKVRP_10065 [Bacteroidota bacterium]
MSAKTAFSKNHTRLLTIVALYACSASLAFGQLVNGRFITSVYTWKQYDTVDVSKTYARGFQSVLLDVAQNDFSLHGHFQGAVMLQSKLDELPDYRLYYGYAQWKNIADVADLSFGRVPFFVGVGSGTIDGALTRLNFMDKSVRLTLYGGANTPLDMTIKEWGPLNKNFTVGGQILMTALDEWRFGLSYMNRQRERPGYWALRADSLFNPTTLYVDPNQTKEQYASGDISYSLPNIGFRVRYDYNIDYEKTQRGQVGVRYYPSDEWIVSAEYLHRAPRLFSNSFFAVFNAHTTDEMEGGVDYIVMPSVRTYVRGAYVQYSGDNSFRYTVGVANDYASASYRGSTGYAGELSTISLQGSYPLCERMFIPTAGVSFTSYKLNVADNTENTLAATLGLIARPLQMLSIDVQGQWLKNKVYENDVRLYVGLNIWFTERLHLFE